MRLPIDIVNSIRLKKVVFNKNGFSRISDYLVEFITIFAIILISFSLISYQYHNHNRIILPLIILIVALAIIGGIVFSFLYTNKLKVIDGFSKEETDMAIAKISESKKWKIVEKEKQFQILQIEDKWDGFHWGKYLVVIFSNDEVLFNCYALDFFGSSSPYHWFGNRKAEKEFLLQMKNHK